MATQKYDNSLPSFPAIVMQKVFDSKTKYSKYTVKVQAIKNHTTRTWVRVMIRNPDYFLIPVEIANDAIVTMLKQDFEFKYIDTNCEYVSLIFLKNQ